MRVTRGEREARPWIGRQNDSGPNGRQKIARATCLSPLRGSCAAVYRSSGSVLRTRHWLPSCCAFGAVLHRTRFARSLHACPARSLFMHAQRAVSSRMPARGLFMHAQRAVSSRMPCARSLHACPARGLFYRAPATGSIEVLRSVELLLAKPRTFPLVSATQVITMKLFFVLKIRPDLA